MTTRDLVFIGVGGICALAGVLAVTTRHLVHSALWLLTCLGALAGVYIVLGQELVGLVQLLVYVGAIVVLVLFALMLTRAPIGRSDDLSTPGWQRAVGAVVAALTAGLVAAVALPLFSADAVHVASGAEDRTAGIGRAIFGEWVWPFELLSVLLLVALVGGLAVARLGPAPIKRAQATAKPAPAPARATQETSGGRS